MSHLTGLRCSLCQTPFPAEALYVCDQCLGPLEVTYDRDATPAHRLARAHRLPAREPLALPRIPADRRRAPDRHDVGMDPARSRGPAGRRAGDARALPEGRFGQSSVALVQGPRGVGRGDTRLRARFRHLRLCVDRQPRQQRRRPRRAAGAGLLRLHPPHARAGEDPRLRRQRTARGRDRRQLRRRQSSVHAGGGALRMGVRQHQPAGLLRRGGEDLRVRDRRAARLALPAASRLPRRGRDAAAAYRSRLRRPARRRGWWTASRHAFTLPRPPAAHPSFTRSTRVSTIRSRCGRTRSPSRLPSATPPTGFTWCGRCASREAAARRPRTRRSWKPSGCWRVPRASSPSRPAARRWPSPASSSTRGSFPATRARWSASPETATRRPTSWPPPWSAPTALGRSLAEFEAFMAARQQSRQAVSP